MTTLLSAHEQIYMLFIYRKNQQEDLTPVQLKAFRKVVRENLT